MILFLRLLNFAIRLFVFMAGVYFSYWAFKFEGKTHHLMQIISVCFVIWLFYDSFFAQKS